MGLERITAERDDERGWALLEAAAAVSVDDRGRALTLLQRVDGDAAPDAGVLRAHLLFGLGRAAEAEAELAAVRSARPGSPAVYEMAAATLEAHGRPAQALRWLTVAASLLPDDELARVGQELGQLSTTARVLWNRRRVREALGYPPDRLDETAEALPRVAAGWPGAFPSAESVLEEAEADSLRGRAVRTLFWRRGELHAAAAHWPELVETVDEDVYFARIEGQLRSLAERGATRIEVVPGEVDEAVAHAVRTGGDVTESVTRWEYLMDRVAAGGAVTWPPQRNAACWCGSGGKYKRCCGSPSAGG